MFARLLCPAALLAFACLFSTGNSDLDLMYDIRSPENQAIVREYQESLSKPADPLWYLPRPGKVAQAALYAEPVAALAPIPSIPGAAAATNVDVAAADEIAHGVLRFAQNLSRQITANYRKTTIFSPLSVISALALLMLGAKGRSHAELSSVFGLADTVKLHEQFGLMLQDVQQPTRQTVSPLRQLDRWHSDSVKRSLRAYPRNRSTTQEVHVANGLFVQQGYSLNPNYR